MQQDIPEQRYDLGIPYQYLSLEDMSALVRYASLWQARNSREQAKRALRRELALQYLMASDPEGPPELA
jgi:uncharacterized protein YbjT (DUF2867 family)